MFNILNIISYNDGSYKITNTDLRLKTNTCFEKNHLIFLEKVNEKYVNNIIRAKTNIYDYCKCNKFKYFITLTINNNRDRTDLKSAIKSINNKIRQLRSKENVNIKYLLIPEEHKKGGWHFHGFFNEGVDKYIYKNKNGFLSISCFDYLGFNSCSIIENYEASIKYITKYVKKEFIKRKKGDRLFYKSNNLEKPKKIIKLLLRGEPKAKFDYKCDFVKIISDLQENDIINILNNNYENVYTILENFAQNVKFNEIFEKK